MEFEVLALRGFENILIGKKLSDVPKIISRICGLCHASQTIVSCKAIEDMYKIKANQQSVLIRRLLMSGELLKSHSMHYFFQSLPDLLNIFNIYKPLDIYDLIKFHPQLASHIYDIIKIGNEIDYLFGGRAIHPITPIPGGTVYRPSQNKKNIIIKYFLKVLKNLEWIIINFIDLFSKLNPPEDFVISNVNFLSLNNNRSYDRYDGIITIKKDLIKRQDFRLEEYSDYFNKDPTIWGIDFNDKDHNFLVGPISRNWVIESYGSNEISEYLSSFDKKWRNNILYSSFLRLIEMYVESQNSLKILEDPALKTTNTLPNLKSIVSREGIGVVEAPRGLLIHHYRINYKNIIEEAKLFIATEINIPLINHMISNYARKLYEKEDLDTIKKEIQKIIRAFDPCISCATH